MDWERYDTVIGTISLIAGILFGIAFILSMLQPLDTQQIISAIFFLLGSSFLIFVYRKAKNSTLSLWQRIPVILLVLVLIVWIGTFFFGLYLLLSGNLY